MEILFAFNKTSVAIGAEQALLQAAVEVRVMSLPSAIRAGCGICLRVSPPWLDEARVVLAAAQISDYSLYTRTEQPGVYLPYNEQGAS